MFESIKAAWATMPWVTKPAPVAPAVQHVDPVANWDDFIVAKAPAPPVAAPSPAARVAPVKVTYSPFVRGSR